MPSGSPSLRAALRLKCPYCRSSPLLAKGSWFTFAVGCPACGYRYEREAGYFTGASWMVAFPVVSLSGLAIGAGLMVLCPDADSLLLAGVASFFMLGFGAFFMPFSMAIWLWAEHRIHPLSAADHLPPKASSLEEP